MLKQALFAFGSKRLRGKRQEYLLLSFALKTSAIMEVIPKIIFKECCKMKNFVTGLVIGGLSTVLAGIVVAGHWAEEAFCISRYIETTLAAKAND
ncbi:MAG: hypothetical protein NC078_11880 [Ruminococcus sp.]|nr:hypothetical protein [Ruminococcus sp.]